MGRWVAPRAAHRVQGDGLSSCGLYRTSRCHRRTSSPPDLVAACGAGGGVVRKRRSRRRDSQSAVVARPARRREGCCCAWRRSKALTYQGWGEASDRSGSISQPAPPRSVVRKWCIRLQWQVVLGRHLPDGKAVSGAYGLKRLFPGRHCPWDIRVGHAA